MSSCSRRQTGAILAALMLLAISLTACSGPAGGTVPTAPTTPKPAAAPAGGNAGESGPVAATPRSVTVDHVPNAAGNRAWRIEGLGPLAASISPNGRYLLGLTRTSGEPLASSDAVTVDLQSGETRRLAGDIKTVTTVMAGPAGAIGWLDKGQALILTQRGAADDPSGPVLSLLKVDLATGTQEDMGDFGHSVNVKRFWLTSDGKRAFVHVAGHVWGLDLASKQRVLDVPVPTWDGLFVLYPSPDGWSVAHPDYDPQGYERVYWLDLKTGKDQPVSPPDLYAQGASWSQDSSRLAFGVSPKHASEYPTLVEEDSTLLLPDAVEIVDLAGQSRQHVELPKLPALWVITDDFQRLIVTPVEVTGDTAQPQGWQLRKRSAILLDLHTGDVLSETKLTPPSRMTVQAVLPADDSGDLFATLSPDPTVPVWQGISVARLRSDGSMELLTGYVLEDLARPMPETGMLLLRSENGLAWANGARLLAGTALPQTVFMRTSHGWVLLDDPDGNVLTVVANPTRE